MLQLNFRQQLIGLLMLVLLTMLLLFAVGHWTKQGLLSNVEHLYQSGAKPIRALGEVGSRLPRMRVGFDVLFLKEVGMAGDKSIEERVSETRAEDIPAMHQALEAALKAQVDPQRAEQVAKLQEVFSVMERESLQPMLQALENGDLPTAKQIYLGSYTKQYRIMRDDANTLLDYLEQDAAGVHQRALDEYHRGTQQALLISAVSIVVALVLGGVIILNLSRRVTGLEAEIELAARNLALNQRSQLKGGDELARIAASYNHLMHSLDQAMGRLQLFAGQVGGAVQQIDRSALQIRDASLMQTDAAQSTAAAVEQVAVSVQLVADNSQQAAAQAQAAQDKAQASTGSLRAVSGQILTISQTLENASHLTQTLAKSSENIGHIVGVIRGISEQTNLLALNAAIEAARAGELGRGFAVVADEVRKLAERTGQATGEIGSLLQGVQGEVAQVVQVMQQGREQMQAGELMVQEAQLQVEEINSDVSQVSISMLNIAHSTSEQGAAAATIAQRIEQIVQMADQNHTAINQTQSNVEQLTSMSQQLRQELGCFVTSTIPETTRRSDV